MNKSVVGWVSLALLIATPNGFAQGPELMQESSEARRSATPIRPVSDGAVWVLRAVAASELQRPKTKQKQGDVAPAPPEKGGFEIESVQAEFSNGVCKALTKYGNGAHALIYRKGNDVLIKHPASGKIVILNAREEPYPGSCNHAGRSDEFAWVSEKFAVGTETFLNRPCAVYRQYEAPRGEIMADAENQSSQPAVLSQAEVKGPIETAKVFRTAYIDLETNLPVALAHSSTASTIWIYEFRSSGKSFTMPPEYAQALEERERTRHNFKQKYTIPQ